ncbi:MAG TPA: hypothetical protein VFD62_15335 [Pyrinomonadaceae bacterium]|nr:hypothetical protein [Pyrinomonadaceae bacterium]
MAATSLSLPIDIPWERICVTTDMLDASPDRAASMPPLWQSSMALYRYVPPDEYQIYPGRRIVYYKLTCTVTNFQPKSEQLVGVIDPGVFSYGYMLNDEIRRRLATSLPCTAAVIQVTVSPVEPGRSVESFPYFIDVQPRQRLLYQQATEAQESTSRSLETVQVRKNAGSTNSVEVLDVDEGGGLNVKVGDIGGGAQRSGKWGVQSLGKRDAELITTSDASREARETLSFTTQLSQMYTLLQAYHLGTNRVSFYLTPRPHTVDPPSGILGPRNLDGIQDFFLIVSQPKDDALPCITARLDTGHLTIFPQFDYDRSEPSQPLTLEIPAPAPLRDDTEATETPIGSNVQFGCRFKSKSDSVSLTAKAGFVIETVQEVESIATGQSDFPNSSLTPEISPDRRTVTLRGTATGYACYRNFGGDLGNVLTVGPLRHMGIEVVPDSSTTVPGNVRQSVIVSFRSELPSNQVGEQYALTLTMRQLKCCDDQLSVVPPKIVAVVEVPTDIPTLTRVPIPGPEPVEVDASIPGIATSDRTISREAVNDLQRWMGEETLRLSNATQDPTSLPAQDDKFLLESLVAGAISDGRRRSFLTAPAQSLGLTDNEVSAIAEATGRLTPQLTRADILAIPDNIIESATRLSGSDLLRLRLSAAGIPTKPYPATDQTRRQPASTMQSEATTPAVPQSGRSGAKASKARKQKRRS